VRDRSIVHAGARRDDLGSQSLRAGKYDLLTPFNRRAASAAQSATRALLVVCTGNLCRSPMAAALFAARAQAAGIPLRVASAGIAAFAGQSAPAPVVALMAKRGLDLSRHRARQLTGTLAAKHDLILVMDRRQQRFIDSHWSELKDRVYRLGAWRDADVVDPYGLSEKSYLDCLAVIDACVGDWGSRLWAEAPPSRRDWPA
jgi:protein-tyrosine phosphatase